MKSLAIAGAAWRIDKEGCEDRLEEMVFDVASRALKDAGIGREHVGNVTIAGHDELDGRSISSMLLAMPAGAFLKDEIKAATIVMSKFQNLPDPPYVVAFCRLDGAHTAMANFLHMDLDDVEAAAAKLQVGARIKVCFHDLRDARMTDFHYELL